MTEEKLTEDIRNIFTGLGAEGCVTQFIGEHEIERIISAVRETYITKEEHKKILLEESCSMYLKGVISGIKELQKSVDQTFGIYLDSFDKTNVEDLLKNISGAKKGDSDERK